MKKIILLLPICLILAGCTIENHGEEYETSLQKIYQQFSKREKKYPKVPETTKDNKIIQEKRNSGAVLRINTYIEHINQPENEDKSFLYTYLNGIFNDGSYTVSDSDLYPLKSVLPQILSGTISFKIIIPQPVPASAIIGGSCVDFETNNVSYTTIFFATGDQEKQEIYTIKNEREGYGKDKPAINQYGIHITGYGILGNTILQWYNLDEIPVDNNILLSYCNDRIQYRYDNNYQGKHLPSSIPRTFSDLARHNKWKKIGELIQFLNKFSIDPTPFGGRYTEITNYLDIQVMEDGILSLSHMWNGDKRPNGDLTGLTYMFIKGSNVYLLYLDIDKYSEAPINSIQDFQNQHPQEYNKFINIVDELKNLPSSI